MPALPDELRILGKTWHFIERPDLIETDDVFGLCDIREQRILYCSETTPSQMRDTILHEVIHAIEGTIGLDLSEVEVHALAAGLYAVAQDNPDWTRWMFCPQS